MLLFAHRGASALAPENTMAAIRLAIEHNADGIEFDIFQHNDEFILIHDRWLHRTTSGSGHIHSIILEELRSLDAGEGQHIPTLFEALQCIGNHCQINIEMKGIEDVELLVKYVGSACTKFGISLDNILYSSFDHHLLKQLRTLSPEARIGALTASKPIDYAAFAEALDAEYINADNTFLDQIFIADAKHRGLKVGVYTVDQAEELIKLKSWGVDTVFCNNPLDARNVLDQAE